MLLGSSFLPLPSSLKLRPVHPSPFLPSLVPAIRLPVTAPSRSSSSAPAAFTVQASKKVQGWVVGDANNKTIKVEVTRLVPHPKYKKYIRIKKKFQVHDPENRFRIGDWVQLQKCRPISKTKHHYAVEVTGPNVPKPSTRLRRRRDKKSSSLRSSSS